MQLPAPAIPTDNLYKFLAISGLVLVVVCLLYPPMLVEQSKTQTARIVSAVSIMKQRVADAERDVQRITERIADAKADPKVSAEEIQVLSDDNERTSNAARQLQIDTAELERDGVIAEAAVQLALDRMILISRLIFVAFAVMVLGFILWYFKVQRYADVVLREQAFALLERAQSPRVPDRDFAKPPAEADSQA